MSDRVRCPYCGHVMRDLYEYNLDDGDATTVECGECEDEFRLRCSISVEYEATAIMPEVITTPTPEAARAE